MVTTGFYRPDPLKSADRESFKPHPITLAEDEYETGLFLRARNSRAPLDALREASPVTSKITALQ